MNHLFVIVVIGLLGGIAIGLQAPLASMINQRLGVLESVFVVHLGGLFAVSVPLILFGVWQTSWSLNFGSIVVARRKSFSILRIERPAKKSR